MPPAVPLSLTFPWFKAAVFALLAWNTAVYAHTDSLNEALDSIAWLALLVLFELETDFSHRFGEGKTAAAIRAARLAAAAAICAAGAGYVREQEWLDAANIGLWIGLVASFELQVRYPRAAARLKGWFAAATTALLGGLGALVLAWLWRGEWFDAYDALLWLTALVIIEINVARGVRRHAHAVPGGESRTRNA